MNINKQYMILEPIQLQWIHVTPTSTNGLEYHLSPSLSIRMEGIISGDENFNMSHLLVSMDGLEVSELEAEAMYESEYLPNKSKERIIKAFKDGQTSAYFNVRQMEYLQQLFEQKNFISYDVSVYYRDRLVEDVVELPPKEFKMITDAFSDMHVQGTFDYKASKEELVEAYEQELKSKAGKLIDSESQSLWEKITNKGVRKRLGKAVGCIVLGVGGIVARQKILAHSGILSSLLAVAFGAVGVVIEMYGRSEAQSIMHLLKIGEKRERVVFS